MYRQPLLLPNKDNTVHYCRSREREGRREISDSSCIINYQNNYYFEHFPRIIRRNFRIFKLQIKTDITENNNYYVILRGTLPLTLMWGRLKTEDAYQD